MTSNEPAENAIPAPETGESRAGGESVEWLSGAAARLRESVQRVIVGKDEAIAVAGDGADERGVSGVITQRSSQGSYRLAESPVGNHDVLPNPIQDFLSVYRLVALRDEEQQ